MFLSGFVGGSLPQFGFDLVTAVITAVTVVMVKTWFERYLKNRNGGKD